MHTLPSRDPQWTVAQFAERSGVPATTLRYWDDEGLLVADRLVNGHRRYTYGHTARLQMIQMCQALGCTADEIRLILDTPDPAARARYAAEKLPEVLEKIEILRVAATVLRHVAECAHPDAASCGAWMREQLPDDARPAHRPPRRS
ncbi:Cu(I)-responsive transcriptional regulator [Catellatospora sp. IY07-71]|uniref:MerR family transcriptional regulator n=1 Tax=Catellatospora sp. IY07-71 TaxID=2728827 RepID=UPI001BB42D9B|nr:MerR family transcriptional regulator [Catellatospora sp. IY07-71]BCJ73795.1 Cu(I)-responsive transcriptional regulator [Catellatospora sp. IY07-71]